MYALPTTRHDGKSTTSNIIQGTLLGYVGSMEKIVYVNDKTDKIGSATHATFDEAHRSLSVADISPNLLAIWGAVKRAPDSNFPNTANVLTQPDHFCVFSASSPFLSITTVTPPVRCTFDHLGLVLE
jgi:hypothetical protein